jgi:peptidoglycan L-alanyl-D-glutamate endopeptidase CwlK
MTYKFSQSSLKKLNSCDNKLVLLFSEVIKEMDCSIICGTRTRQEQEKAFCSGTSKLHFPNSKHNSFPSRAVDVLPYPFNGWDDLVQFDELAEVVKRNAHELGIKIQWGGDWSRFGDFPHWELA